MKRIIKVCCLICICVTGILAQKAEQLPTIKRVEVPREKILQVSVLRPDCPVRFEDVHFYTGIEPSGGINSYRLRNIGTKPIRSVEVYSTNGAGAVYVNKETGVLMMPGQLMPEFVCDDCRKDEVVPLTDNLRKKLDLEGPMGRIIFLIVVKVEFTDGTKYSDEKTLNSLTDYLEELDNMLEKQKQQTVKKP